MYAVTNAAKISNKSTMESTIQINGLLSAVEGKIKDFQVASMARSVTASGFIVVEASFGMVRR